MSNPQHTMRSVSRNTARSIRQTSKTIGQFRQFCIYSSYGLEGMVNDLKNFSIDPLASAVQGLLDNPEAYDLDMRVNNSIRAQEVMTPEAMRMGRRIREEKEEIEPSIQALQARGPEYTTLAEDLMHALNQAEAIFATADGRLAYHMGVLEGQRRLLQPEIQRRRARKAKAAAQKRKLEKVGPSSSSSAKVKKEESDDDVKLKVRVKKEESSSGDDVKFKGKGKMKK